MRPAGASEAAGARRAPRPPSPADYPRADTLSPESTPPATGDPGRRRQGPRPAIPAGGPDEERVKTRHMATETAQQQSVPADVSEHLTTEDRVGLLRAMLMMRGIEERAMTLYRQGQGAGAFFYSVGPGTAAARAT